MVTNHNIGLRNLNLIYYEYIGLFTGRSAGGGFVFVGSAAAFARFGSGVVDDVVGQSESRRVVYVGDVLRRQYGSRNFR